MMTREIYRPAIGFGLTLAVALALFAGPILAVETDSGEAPADSSMALSGGEDGTVFKSLTIEGENRVQITLERPELVIDLDPQANSTMSNVDLEELNGNMYDVLKGGTSLADVIVPGALDNLFIAPSRIAMAKLEVRMAGELDAPYRLKDCIDSLGGEYDAIIIGGAIASRLLSRSTASLSNQERSLSRQKSSSSSRWVKMPNGSLQRGRGSRLALDT